MGHAVRRRRSHGVPERGVWTCGFVPVRAADLRGSSPAPGERGRIQGDSPIWTALNTRPKYVASNSPFDPKWENTMVLSGDVAAAIRELKARRREGELEVHGSGVLVRWLLGEDLVGGDRTCSPSPWSWGKALACSLKPGPDIALEAGRIAGGHPQRRDDRCLPPKRASGVRNGMNVRNVRWVGVATPRYPEMTKLFREVMGLRVELRRAHDRRVLDERGGRDPDHGPGRIPISTSSASTLSARSRSSRWTTCSPRGPN